VHRLVLWNIDLTLIDVAKVTRAAYAAAFREVTGRPLVQLPQMAGRSEPELFFDALALNGVDMLNLDVSERLLPPFSAALATAMADRKDDLTTNGQLLPGAPAALAAVGGLDGVVQSVLTGSSRQNAELKLAAFGLDKYIDVTIGGYGGSDPYPKGTLLRVARQRAEDTYNVGFDDTVYIADALSDIAAARVGGARCIAIASGRESNAALRDAGPDAVLPDLTDTAALIALLATG
jgi:phosphoglycolate phosphatase-like HAD superfamily hydrolase